MKNRSLVHLFLCLGIFAASTFIFACGDDDTDSGEESTTEDAGSGDGGTSDDGGAEGNEGEEGESEGETGNNSFVRERADSSFAFAAFYATNYADKAEISLFDFDTLEAKKVLSVYTDATLRVKDSVLFAIDRFGGDKIEAFDTLADYKNFFTKNAAVALDSGANPQDLVISENVGYVTQYGLATMVTFDSESGDKLSTIDFTAWADSDGIPEMAQMALLDNKLYVAIQRLTNWAPTNTSYIAVLDISNKENPVFIDTNAETEALDGITLGTPNPTSNIILANGYLCVFCSGDYSNNEDGKLEIIDPVSYKVVKEIDIEKEFGASIVPVWLFATKDNHVLLNSPAGIAKVNLQNLDEAPVVVLDVNKISLGGYAYVSDANEIWAYDTNPASTGLRIFDYSSGDELTVKPLPAGSLSPSEIAFIQ